MFEIFRKYLSAQGIISEQDIRRVYALSKEMKIAKSQFILREGERSAKMYFVAKGLLRLFRTNGKGGEYTLKFSNENRWINDKESYISGNPASVNIETLEESKVLVWEKDDFDPLLKEITSFKNIMKALGARNQIANQNRIYTVISNSAEEKYLQFVEKYPDIFNRVPLHIVASYLGVTRETLSRIRRSAAHK